MLKILKKRRNILLFCLLAIVTILMIYSISFLKKFTRLDQPRNNIPAGEICEETKIGQTFVAQYDSLTAIEALLATYNRKNTGEFIFHLQRELSNQEDLFSYRGDISKVKDNKYFRFRFPKIKEAKGKKFYFYLEAPQSRLGNAITIWANSEDLYKEGEKIVNGAPSEGDLVFKTVYDLGLKGNLAVFLGEITRNKPFPLNKKSFYVTLILLFVLSCSLFMTFLIKFFVEG